MYRQTLVLFLITLFLASTITVDARKPCTITKTSSDTITISTTCSSTPTPQQIHQGKKKHQKRQEQDCNFKRNKKIVTITPTTTVCTTSTPVCTLPGGTCDIKNPEACCSQKCSIQNDGSFACCAKIGNKFECDTKLKDILFIHN
ncbi:hypothetical protein RhiirA5_363561 [Rhizophagus irregularis]|jgi:hypothetical protein|uniref:Uncharacterized protein n=4 Tax=Rhizophagus irregularis TaxID=588596 RepID=A0A2N1N298_9GLOM|nr:hypothetical protein GLOIN_2v1535308 [Rhizophagus irregularis DAOM 181602=DAOM 197198]EXX57789.1 hypothetical protein RirG_203840 [Rhizophagus irregularis DAOM 197198w]PKC03077.1 hypothetical protein RhiirA5_363561 [Rhizophagus irregularis]PKK68025.1 hypothetical protein RhiirC2_750874 [Rhizophagus irregularis]POG78818.1 hypothetical protein GLOIN_2v1535308 [Rhizophagus irregularis DAOM 181602=DAOM 197198]UZO28716.1 hypothetical protein OCT59_022230 [Rhizophagus irregularis]|eukprot:XP_025185684.1 hypothetical protein GLOIN_2v1535308 [Rhizophagus irregularis DAOM 181602=DAOM 197198]